jgi:hypothetical protein
MKTHESESATAAESDKLHLLRIYLRDHEAASVGGLELFRRCSKSNEGTAYAAELQRLTSDIRSDRDALRDICRLFDVKFSKVGRAMALAGVTVGRVKLNGRVFSYSPLSRVVELEAMSAGVMSKLRLWQSLLLLANSDTRLDETALIRHQTEAFDQLDVLRHLHDMAVNEAFV